MRRELSGNEIDIWSQVSESFKQYYLARRDFFADAVDRVGLIRAALDTADRMVAITVARDLSPKEHMELFDEWVFLAGGEGAVAGVREFILSMPRDWVLERIEKAVDPHLGDDQDFRRYLELFIMLDRDLALKLAQRAAENSDEFTRETGEEFLEYLKDNNSG